MSNREEILDLMHRYAFLIDNGEIEEWASLFEHGEWGAEGSPLLVGKDALVEMINAFIRIYPDGTPRTRHAISNVSISIDEANNSASAISYITLSQQTDEFPLQVIFTGEYHDRFERVDGHWRFAKRVTKRPFLGDMSAHNKKTFG